MPPPRNFYSVFIDLSFFPLPNSLKNYIIDFLRSGTPDAKHYLGQV